MEITKIILCGRRCTGKTTLFWDLQKTLNWPIFSVSEYLRSYIHRYNLKTVSEIDAKNPEISGELNERLEKLLSSPNQVIIDTRFFAGIRARFPHTLKILLLASEHVRLKRAAYREGTSIDIQRERLLKKEAEWVKKMQKFYPFDFFAPRYFDLVIDTTDKTPQEVTDIVTEKLQNAGSS